MALSIIFAASISSEKIPQISELKTLQASSIEEATIEAKSLKEYSQYSMFQILKEDGFVLHNGVTSTKTTENSVR